MVISILNTKGGVGKTTLAVNLAHAFQLKGLRVLLVDADPQGSARDWHSNSGGEILEVIGLDRPTLDKDILRFRYQYDIIFIDGAPSLSAMTTRAIICSDLVLIPVQPSPYDVWATSDLVGLLKQRQEINQGKPAAYFIISRAIVKTRLARDVTEALKEYNLETLNSGTSQRVKYASSASTGHTVLLEEGEAKLEIKTLAEEVEQLLKKEGLTYGA